jgi:hypothetical protein
MAIPLSEIFAALAKFDFEARLLEGGGLAIFDLRYQPGKGLQLRQPPEGLARLVFNNAERIGAWLEGETEEDGPPPLRAASFDEARALIRALLARRDRSR